ncbi:hypothetical protein BH10ACT2_BH10ACT2_22050 [soil metagenome]
MRSNPGTRACGVLILAGRSLATVGVWAWAVVAPVAFVSLGVAASEAQSRQRIISDDAQATARGDNVLLLVAPGAVNATACEALSRIDGVVTAGAYRHASDVHLAQEPNDPVPVFEVTAGMLDNLTLSRPPTLRVLLGAGLARELGVQTEVAVLEEPTTAWPADSVADGSARIPELTRSIMTLVPATGLFDTCMVEYERIKLRDADSIVLALEGDAGRNVSIGTLSGVPVDRVVNPVDRLLNESPTQPLVVAGLLCLLTGLVSFRLRRREFTVLAYSGFGRASRLLIMVAESLPLLLGAVAAALVGTRILEPALDSRLCTLVALRAGAVSATLALIGLGIATLTQRTRQALVVLRDD